MQDRLQRKLVLRTVPGLAANEFEIAHHRPSAEPADLTDVFGCVPVEFWEYVRIAGLHECRDFGDDGFAQVGKHGVGLLIHSAGDGWNNANIAERPEGCVELAFLGGPSHRF